MKALRFEFPTEILNIKEIRNYTTYIIQHLRITL